MDYIKKPALDTKNTGGNVGQPGYKEGETTLIRNQGFDIGGGDVSTTASDANLSKKFKYPAVSQDIAAVQVQYED